MLLWKKYNKLVLLVGYMAIFFVVEDVKRTVLDFFTRNSKVIVNVTWFCFIIANLLFKWCQYKITQWSRVK